MVEVGGGGGGGMGWQKEKGPMSGTLANAKRRREWITG